MICTRLWRRSRSSFVLTAGIVLVLCAAPTAATAPDAAAAAHTALHDADANRRAQALPHVRDAAVLAQVALRDPDGSVRAEAAQRIDDPDTLLQVALSEGAVALGAVQKAVARLAGHEPQLRRLVESRADPSVRLAALQLTRDQELLARVALGSDGYLPRAAAQALKDPQVSARVLATSNDAEIRRVVVPRVRNPQVLAEVALRTRDAYLLCWSIEHIDDPAALRQLAELGREPAVDRHLSALAALKLLLLEPRVQAKLPQAALRCSARIEERSYRKVPNSHHISTVRAQAWSLRVTSAGRDVARRAIGPDFPQRLDQPPRDVLAPPGDLGWAMLAVADAAGLSEADLVALMLPSPAPDMRAAALTRVRSASAPAR